LPSAGRAPLKEAATPQFSPTRGLLSCDSLIGQPLVKVPEIVSDPRSHVLRGTIVTKDRQERLAFRTPPGLGNVPGKPGLWQVCQPQYVRYYESPEATPQPPPPPPGGYPDPLPGPTLRARVGDVVELSFVNEINPLDFGNSIDRAENGLGNGCDQSTGGGTKPGYPANLKDKFPDCFHGSSTANIHFHGTHTNPNGTGDNVLIEVRPLPRANGRLTLTEAAFKPLFDPFFKACEDRLMADPLDEWPQSWKDAPLGPLGNPRSYVAMQERLLKAYDKGRPEKQRLWPADEYQYNHGVWPQYYIGAVPYCFRLPEYTAKTWPPASNPAPLPLTMGPMAMAPSILMMGQSPGTHWYHAHKHGSTDIDVSNGMTGAFIIEGAYDDALNAFYKAVPSWTRTQPVLVVNQLGVTPNPLRAGPGRTDKGPDFSVNGRLQPKLKMYPGEVQMWRIVNSSPRSAMYLASLPPGFTWRQLAQDGVQFAPDNYEKSQNRPLNIAAGNRVDLLVKAPLAPGLLPVQVAPNVASAEINIVPDAHAIGYPEATPPPFTLLSVDVSGQGPEMQPIPKDQLAPLPPDLADITDGEITGTETLVFNSGPPGSEKQHTINGEQFGGEVGEVVLLNRAEEWKVVNNTTFTPVDHPFHIHINPFQVTEIFDPNEVVTVNGKPAYKYVADPSAKSPQCYINPLDQTTWKPCDQTKSTERIWWDVFPIPSGRSINGADGKSITIGGYFKLRSRFVDYPGYFVLHCHILAHEDRGMMIIVEVAPRILPYAHQ
jgi:FtsP/CotA-like multicopper oxidase with cupredoxin domain